MEFLKKINFSYKPFIQKNNTYVTVVFEHLFDLFLLATVFRNLPFVSPDSYLDLPSDDTKLPGDPDSPIFAVFCLHLLYYF